MASLLVGSVDDLIKVYFKEEWWSAHALRCTFFHPDGDIFSISYPNIAVKPFEKGELVWWQDCFFLEDSKHDVPVDWVEGAFNIYEEGVSIFLDSSTSDLSVLEGIHDVESF
jgi:hypothetical protein